jgi:acetyl-CoA carboxylase biotin carboxylase subunit
MFRTLLIANRGEVAARVARTARRMGIRTVVVASSADVDQQWLAEVDVVVPIGPARAAASYLDVDALLEVAVHHGCAAVHPGWGFLSENDRFAARCEAAGVTFVGPEPRHLRMMGDKVVARRVMSSLGLPVIPGSDGALPGVDEARRLADEVGYPVMIKAVSGGGGRGMRHVDAPSELARAYEDAAAEALAGFGDASLYLEKRIDHGRHVEVQLVGDRWGTCVHLGERECSVQRRHQKVVEEGPSPGLSASERDRVLPLVADAMARAGYRGAGTVEMLLDPEGRLYFMEMNTRLQVEHGVSELLTGVDLVEWQLRVAANERLPVSAPPPRSGHVMEFRINAEDPDAGFAPSPGVVHTLRWPAAPWVRVDTHLRPGDRIPPNYDSMVAKLLVRGDDREDCLRRSRDALAETQVEGVRTNLALHRRLLDWAPYRTGAYDTTSLETALRSKEI